MTTEKLIDDAVRAFEDREIPAPSRDHLRIALDAYDASLTKCGCPDCTAAHRERTGLTDHDRKAVARALHEIVYAPGASFDRAVPGIQEHMLACADKVAAALPWAVPQPEVEVTLEALTPTDEREALGAAWDDGNAVGLDGWVGPGRGTEPVDDHAIQKREEAVTKLAAGFRRSVVPEPSTEHECTWACWVDKYGHAYHAGPQGEPSDAQALAAFNAFFGLHLPIISDESMSRMRAALRAASSVTEQGEPSRGA